MNANAKRANWLLGLVGGAGGGVAGYFLYFWLASQGFYAIVLPGAAIGLGCGALSRGKSNALGAVCGLFGAGLESTPSGTAGMRASAISWPI